MELVRKLAIIHYSHDKQAVQLLTPNHTIGGSLTEQALRRANPLRSYTAAGQGGGDMLTGAAAAVTAMANGPAQVAVNELLHVSEAVVKAAAYAKGKGTAKPAQAAGGAASGAPVSH
jgi:hypothetical protein